MARGNGKIANAETLDSIVERVAALFDQQKELAAEIKTLAGAAWEPHGISAKAIKQLAKEKRMGEVAREARRQYEEQLETARAKLGMLFDTPLGQAAMSEAAAENNGIVLSDDDMLTTEWTKEKSDENVREHAKLKAKLDKKAQRDAKPTQRKKSARSKKGSGGKSNQLDEWL